MAATKASVVAAAMRGFISRKVYATSRLYPKTYYRYRGDRREQILLRIFGSCRIEIRSETSVDEDFSDSYFDRRRVGRGSPPASRRLLARVPRRGRRRTRGGRRCSHVLVILAQYPLGGGRTRKSVVVPGGRGRQDFHHDRSRGRRPASPG